MRDFAPLFIPSATTTTARLVPHLLLAFASGMLHRSKNAATGREEIVCTYTDNDGFDVHLPVAATEKEALSKIPTETALIIERKVEEFLGSDNYRLAESRETLFKAAVAFVNTYKDKMLHGDASNGEYLRLKQDALEAKTRLLRLG